MDRSGYSSLYAWMTSRVPSDDMTIRYEHLDLLAGIGLDVDRFQEQTNGRLLIVTWDDYGCRR